MSSRKEPTAPDLRHDKADHGPAAGAVSAHGKALGDTLALELLACDADWLWESDADHRIRALSPSYQAATGIDPKRVIGRSRLEAFLSSAVRGEGIATHLADLQAHRPFRDFVYQLKEGSERCRWISVSGVPRFGADGGFIGYAGIGRNVTKMLSVLDDLSEARRELSLRENNERLLKDEIGGDSHAGRLMSALNVMQDAFCYYDANDELVLYNEAMVALYRGLEDIIRPGLSFTQLIETGLERNLWLLDGHTPEAFRQHILDKRRNETRSESLLAFANGTWVMHREIRLEDGGTIGICTDITQHKQNEVGLEMARGEAEEARQRLQSAIDALDDGFVLWDRDDRLLAFNQAFARQFAFLPGLRVGRTFSELFAEFAHTGVVEAARGREDEWVAEHVATRQADLGKEIEFQTHDGRWMLRRDVSTANGDRVGIRTDITDYKNRECQLAEANQMAEKRLHDLRRSLDTLTLGVVILDADLNAEIVNQAFYDIWNVTPEQVGVGHPFRALMDVNRHNGVYDVADRSWEEYVEYRLEEIRSGDVPPREFRRADGCTMIYSVTSLTDDKRLVSYYDITTMKEREAQLAEALEKARLAEAVIDSVPNPMFVKDSQLRFVMANGAFAEMFGTTADAMLGKRGADFVPADEASSFEESERQVLASGELYEVEEDFEFAGIGHARIVRKNRVSTQSDTDYVACSIFDVTDLKRREAESIEARNYVASVLETLPAGVIIYDRDDRFVLANDKVKEALPAMVPAMQPGKPLREAVEVAHAAGYFRQSGDPALDALYDVDRAAWIDGYMKRYDAINSVFERQNPDGRWFQAFDTRKPDGTYVGVRVDITELKRREADLRHTMAQIELYRHVLDELPVSTYVKSRDLAFEFVNKAWAEITGVPREEALGKCDRDFFGEEGEGFASRDLAVLETGKPDETEETLTRRDGTVRQLIAKKSRLVSDDGTVHLIGSSTDISELKEREAELQEAQRRAVLADRAKSEFLANMSHEIRTPMNGVLGMAELLAKSELDPRQKTFTDIIVKSGNALLTIINDILDFSKIDAGQLVLDPAPFNLAEAIEDVATLVSTRAKEKNLEMIVRVEPGLHDSFVGDVGRIRQIITNLLGNAVKFTDQGHVLVDVTGEELGAQTRLHVAVTDTGIGIPQDKLQQVFDKFSQVDASSTRRHEGTGLGLAITSRLVALMGGEVGVKSREGEGSTFWFTITLDRAGTAEKERTMPIDVSGARILVVDDNEVNRAILMEQMASWGFDACAASGGEEGIAVLKAVVAHGLAVDCMILDYQMPVMSGAEVARIIRATPEIAGTPIVMLTSVDQSLGQSSHAGLRIDAHLIKPARSSALLEAVVSTIQRHRGRGADAVSDEPAAPVQKSPAPPARKTPGELRLPAQPAGGLHRVDILVAEDNEVNQLVFTQILGETGLTFEIVGNGRLAVEARKSMNPRMILMDVSMPEMNGLEATGKIREMEAVSGEHVPIIGVTAHALKGDRERCIDAGMDDYLSKPISPKTLTQKIARWIENGGEEVASA